MSTLERGFSSLLKSIELANKALVEAAAVWTTKYVNDLPNAAFAVVEKGYKEGSDKRARHLPHHTAGVKSPTENSTVDLPHYRNALARMNQIKSVLGTESEGTLRKKAATHLNKHRAVLKASMYSFSEREQELWADCELLFNSNVKPLLEG